MGVVHEARSSIDLDRLAAQLVGSGYGLAAERGDDRGSLVGEDVIAGVGVVATGVPECPEVSREVSPAMDGASLERVLPFLMTRTSLFRKTTYSTAGIGPVFSPLRDGEGVGSANDTRWPIVAVPWWERAAPICPQPSRRARRARRAGSMEDLLAPRAPSRSPSVLAGSIFVRNSASPGFVPASRRGFVS
jgi:hypothetical protein